MRVVSQGASLPVRHVGVALGLESKTPTSRHGPLLPDSVRVLFVGPSACGKTNAAMALLTDPNGLKFEHVYLYTTTASQHLYEYLKRVMAGVVGMHVFSQRDSVVPPAKANPNSVFVFDDVATENQDCMRAYFAAGRHKHIDVMYLSQTYTKIPKQLVRDNANMIAVFRQDEHNLQCIFREHVEPDFTSLATFKQICADVWRTPYTFLLIDKTRTLHDGRYRIGFDRFLVGDVPR